MTHVEPTLPAPMPPSSIDFAAVFAAQAEQEALMLSANPAFIPRNHRIEAMIQAAVEGDMAPFERLLAACRAPYETRAEWADLAEAPQEGQEVRQTFCGT